MVWAEQLGFAAGKAPGILETIVFSYFMGALSAATWYAGYVRIRRFISFFQSRNEIMRSQI